MKNLSSSSVERNSKVLVWKDRQGTTLKITDRQNVDKMTKNVDKMTENVDKMTKNVDKMTENVDFIWPLLTVPRRG
jgi:hypothetical protein